MFVVCCLSLFVVVCCCSWFVVCGLLIVLGCYLFLVVVCYWRCGLNVVVVCARLLICLLSLCVVVVGIRRS